MNDSPNRVKRMAPTNQDPRRLKRRRLIARMTIRQAAEAAGISTGYVSELERGNRSAGAAVLGQLADAYGCTVEDLLPREAKVAA